MNEIGITTLILIVVNGLVTYKGLKSVTFFNNFSFNIDQILVEKDFKRLITSGFLHANWTHFLFNVITLYIFGKSLETSIGIPAFLLVYTMSLIGGNLFTLFIHRNHPDYSAIGASGAISGVIFAFVGMFPGLEMGLLLIPIHIPAWIFGIAYVLYSIYGIKTQSDKIGHEAHLGGGIVGLFIAIILKPSILATNTFAILLILIPSLVFLFFIIKKPYLLLLSNPFSKSKGLLTQEDKYNTHKLEKQEELDKLLDKISTKGYDKLTKKEKQRLNDLSK